jgi:hypothetical protein
MKKRNFLLLEILLAVTLLALCIVPLVRNPICFYKKEMETLIDLEKKRIENEALLEIRQLLFKNQIPWNEFPMRNKEEALVKTLILQKPITIGELKNKDLPLLYRIWTKQEKKVKQNKTCRKIAIEVTLDKEFKEGQKYTKMIVFIQKQPIEIKK